MEQGTTKEAELCRKRSQPLALIGAVAPSRGGAAQLSCGRGHLCH